MPETIICRSLVSRWPFGPLCTGFMNILGKRGFHAHLHMCMCICMSICLSTYIFIYMYSYLYLCIYIHSMYYCICIQYIIIYNIHYICISQSQHALPPEGSLVQNSAAPWENSLAVARFFSVTLRASALGVGEPVICTSIDMACSIYTIT